MSPKLKETVESKCESLSHFNNPYITSADLKVLCASNQTLEELYSDMVAYCVRYLVSVCEFMLSDMEGRTKEFEEVDRRRRIVHNGAIDSINILARNLNKAGRNATWISKMQGNRAAYAKFAQLIAFETIQEKGLE